MSWSRLSILTLAKSKSRHFQEVSLNYRDIWIKISWFCLNSNLQVSTFWSRSRFIKTYWDLSRLFRFLWISWLFLNLDQEIIDFYKYLAWDFSSQHFLFTFMLLNWLQNGQKVWENQIFVSKMQKSSKSLDKNWEISKSLDKSWKSWLVSKVS